jgi:hypothetical protein
LEAGWPGPEVVATRLRLPERCTPRLCGCPRERLPGGEPQLTFAVSDGTPTTGNAEEQVSSALLALSVGRVVSAAWLVERLCAPQNMPADPMYALRIRVSKLRRLSLRGAGRMPRPSKDLSRPDHVM